MGSSSLSIITVTEIESSSTKLAMVDIDDVDCVGVNVVKRWSDVEMFYLAHTLYHQEHSRVITKPHKEWM